MQSGRGLLSFIETCADMVSDVSDFVGAGTVSVQVPGEICVSSCERESRVLR